MEKEKIIIDVDTGTDDAVALCMAMLSDRFDVLGICSVNGNIEVKLTTDNSLRVVECCRKQKEVRVYRGAEFPLVSTLMSNTPQYNYPIPHREGMHREGMIHSLHLSLPEAKIKEEKQCATSWIIETLLEAEDRSITMITLGPATNLALAMRADPRIIGKIKRIVSMAGGHDICNSTAASEFNVFADPEAFEIMLQSGCDITLFPLDVTYKVPITYDEAKRIGEIGTPPAKLVEDVILYRINSYGKRDTDMPMMTPLHDPLVLCYLEHPEVVTKMINTFCSVDIGHGVAYGRTVLDRRNKINGAKPNCHFALDADKNIFLGWMMDILEKDREKNRYE